MKFIRQILPILFFLSVLSLQAQNAPFSGHIQYSHRFLLPNGVDITSNLSKILGKGQDYYIGLGNYKASFDGSAFVMQIYNGKTNKHYTIMANKTAMVVDAAQSTDSIMSIVHSENDTLIAGRNCKKVVIKSLESTTTYYFDPSLTVDIVPFQQHRYGGWADYLKASKGALPIKYVMETKDFIWEAVATKIEALDLNISDFDLPEGVKVD